jgi:hypothetical protein
MKPVPVHVTFDGDSGYGVSTFTRKFQDAESALSYLSGYLGNYDIHISNFTVDFLWDE